MVQLKCVKFRRVLGGKSSRCLMPCLHQLSSLLSLAKEERIASRLSSMRDILYLFKYRATRINVKSPPFPALAVCTLHS